MNRRLTCIGLIGFVIAGSLAVPFIPVREKNLLIRILKNNKAASFNRISPPPAGVVRSENEYFKPTETIEVTFDDRREILNQVNSACFHFHPLITDYQFEPTFTFLAEADEQPIRILLTRALDKIQIGESPPRLMPSCWKKPFQVLIKKLPDEAGEMGSLRQDKHRQRGN